MGYENENAEPLFTDIETTGREDIDDQIEMPDAPANYKDPQKILEFKLEKLKALVEKSAIDMFLNRITAIGVWTPSLGISVVTCQDLAEEKLALAAFAVLVSNNGHRRRLMGFNHLHFDVPNLIMRAKKQKLKFPLTLSDVTPRWRHARNDLMEVMTFEGRFAKHSLDYYCDFLDIDSETTDDVKALTGADMPRLASEGRYDLIAAHCRHDLIRTVKLAQEMDVFSYETGLQEDHTGRESGSYSPF